MPLQFTQNHIIFHEEKLSKQTMIKYEIISLI